MNVPLLQVKDLCISFADTTAVNNISFDINPGELVAIVGESGSGKSVTSLSLLQLLPAKAAVKGEMIFSKNDQPPVNLLTTGEKNIRAIRGKDIAMIFQEPMSSLNPVFTCGHQVMEAIRLHQGANAKTARQRTIELFEKVKLPHPATIINRYPHELSGGQKQRVMIAMAICCQPSLLIADEPTTALDVTVQQTILELIKELQLQTQMGVLFITHDLGLVADIADKVVVMYRGTVVEQGPAISVLKNPQHSYTKALLQCRPALHEKGERLPVIGDEIRNKKPEIRNEKVSGSEHTMNYEPATVLEVQDLKVYYAGKKMLFKKSTEPYKAVDGVSFTVSRGETLGLVGESGCGKTTLGRAILQLTKATSGKIILNGTDLLQLPHRSSINHRKDLQIVFQDPYGSLNPRLTIGDAITEPLQVHGIYNGRNEQRDKVVELLEKVNLQADHFNRYPHQFSGGQRQRICIARALALNPSFLIFDESVSALDVSVQAQVLNLLNDLKKEFRFTSIFISHDLSVVRYISDRILVMQQGKIVEEGLANDIYCNPKHPYTRKLTAAIPGKSLAAL